LQAPAEPYASSVRSGVIPKHWRTDNYRVPNPAGLVPTGAIGKQRISKWEEAYRTYDGDDPYPDNGIVIVPHQGSRINGWARFDLWLPTPQHNTATEILNSVRLSG
jgi:hypothetical protein